MADTPSILVIEENSLRAAEIRDGLSLGGWSSVTILENLECLSQELSKTDPDIILIDLATPNRDALENLSNASGAAHRPVAMFVDQTDAELTRLAMQAGLSAYVVDGLEQSRILPVLETAIERFRFTSQLRSERDAAKRALEERKTIDRAKGLLMRAKGVSEEEAYQRIRKTAMNPGRKVIDVAQALVTAADMLA
ncbi:ANTAR domain-containing protein [uncultured Shimia sp.]|uniref:ANTAR domain-containing response regulator n=1 Tax=uncultured Shimia sp. TaxID=573152 RepID=UPI0026054CD9|nr:ANTAR domain-containing protein [uncultured Shimia sp.]